MSTSTDSEAFYAGVPILGGFRSLMDPARYTALPDDWTIGVADVVQSTKAIAEKRYKAVNMAGAAVITALIDRYPILIWAGAALLGWVAGRVIATDPAVVQHLTSAFGETFAQEAELAAACAATLLAVAAGGLWSRLEAAEIRAEAKRAQASAEASTT